jgi:hypothetical protein
MLISEALLITEILDRHQAGRILDCGSGMWADRHLVQPWISAAYAGYDVTWTNLYPEKGCTVCDFTRPETLRALPRCDTVTCCSLLEHVTDIDAAIDSVVSLVERILIVSVPWNFPLHDCPIDNGWRPSPGELAERVSRRGLTVVGTHVAGPEDAGPVKDATVSLVVARAY